MSLFWILASILLVFPSFAQEQLYDRQDISLNMTIGADMLITKERADSYIERVSAKLGFFPIMDEQDKILSVVTQPQDSEITEDYIRFSWSDPSEDRMSFEAAYRLKNSYLFKEINKKEEFPIKEVPMDIWTYLYPKEIIDSDNKKIAALASSLADGDSDLFVVVYNIASWVKNNVQYNLSTINEKATKQASWVLENKRGVCNEITSLFIALLRSVGVPARFVAGISYTNSDVFADKWGAHGWAEVYFPDYGWVPFDVTYGEFGYVDATHIKMKVTDDAKVNAVNYEWTGVGVEVTSSELHTHAELESVGQKIAPIISISLNPLKKEVGFGSYDIIEATIKNLKDSYVVAQLSLSKVTELENIGSLTKEFLLKPSETKRVYWLVKVKDDLDRGYVFTFPFMLTSFTGEFGRTSFDSKQDSPVLPFSEAQEIMAGLEEAKEKGYSSNLEISCSSEKSEYYTYETGKINCTLKNKGSEDLRKLDVCIADDCRTVDIGRSQDGSVVFDLNFSEAYPKSMIVTARNSYVSVVSNPDIRVLDVPRLDITGVEFPQKVVYNQSFDIAFAAEKLSSSSPEDVYLTFSIGGLSKRWRMDQLNDKVSMTIPLKGYDLDGENTRFKIAAEYKDKNNRAYSEEKEFYISLEDMDAGQRFVMLLKKIGRLIGSIFSSA